MQRWMHVRRSLDFLSLSLSDLSRRPPSSLSLPSFPPIVPPPPFHSDVYFAISSSLPLPLNRRLQEEKISIPFNWIIAAELRFRGKTGLFSARGVPARARVREGRKHLFPSFLGGFPPSPASEAATPPPHFLPTQHRPAGERPRGGRGQNFWSHLL